MNQLSYGWNKNDLNSHEIVKLKIKDKLCGSFIPGQYESEESDKEVTKEHYYLASLDKSEFHKFDPKQLSSTKVPLEINEINISNSGLSIFSGNLDKEIMQDKYGFIRMFDEDIQYKLNGMNPTYILTEKGFYCYDGENEHPVKLEITEIEVNKLDKLFLNVKQIDNLSHLQRKQIEEIIGDTLENRLKTRMENK